MKSKNAIETRRGLTLLHGNGESAFLPMSEQHSQNDPSSILDGDRGAAEARLRRFAELAIQNLSTEMLNVASYHIAVYTSISKERMKDELASERAELRAWWNNEGRRLLAGARGR
jgi:hypothetical protein